MSGVPGQMQHLQPPVELRSPSIQPLRVTRRGNVYDDTLRRSVFATWGMGSIRERRLIAQAWIDGVGLTDNQPTAEDAASSEEWR